MLLIYILISFQVLLESHGFLRPLDLTHTTLAIHYGYTLKATITAW